MTIRRLISRCCLGVAPPVLMASIGATSLAAAPPNCFGVHDAERTAAIGAAHSYVWDRWFEREGRWYSAYEMKPEVRAPFALPQPAPSATALNLPPPVLNGHIVARGLECTAIDVKPNEIYLIRYTTPVFRFSEGKGWSAEFQTGRLHELLVQRQDGRWKITEQLEGRTVLPEDAVLTKPSYSDVIKVIHNAKITLGIPSR
jgi:hypothetical protein